MFCIRFWKFIMTNDYNEYICRDSYSLRFGDLKLSGGDALMGNTRTHAEHEG